MVRYLARDRFFFIIVVVYLVLKIPCQGKNAQKAQFLRFWDWGVLLEHFGDRVRKLI